MTTAAPDTPALQTFLIADVRGYTSFTVEHGDEAAARLATRFGGLVEEVVQPRGGKVIELRGDEALAVFPSARQAPWVAVELQGRFSQESQADPSLPLRVGIGLDAGEAVPVEGGYRGTALNLAARLCSLAGAGEVLASETVTNLARKLEGLEYADRGAVNLKGFADAVRIVHVASAAPAEGTAEAVESIELAEERVEQRLPIGGFLGSLPATPLVAREGEFQQAMRVVDAVIAHEGRLLLLEGEPGIGKTRLAQEITLNVRNRGFLIASGRCYEPEQVVPYYPIREALAMLYDACPPSLRADVPRRWQAMLQLLPGEDVAGHATGGSGQEEQQRLFYAVTGFLQAVAELAPVALLIDDLH